MCTLISSLVILTIILAGLILLEPTVGFISIFLFGAFYFSMGYFSKKRLSILGSNVNFQSGYLVRLMQEAFGGIRDIILERLQSQYSSAFSKAEFEMRYAQGSMQIIGQAPRYVIETIGTIGIILIALYLARLSGNADTSIFLPILAVIALGAQRLLPILQQIYYNFTLLRSGGAALREVNEVLKLNNAIPCYLPTFLKPVFGDIKFQNLNFKFKGGTVPIFNNVNLEIERGEVVGIIGKTGEGKSTFLDLLMGLLEPTAGSIYVDHVKLEKNNTLAWQKSIAHVPQSIFLADKTIYENIAFGFDRNEIDYIRLYEVAKLSKVCEFVDSLPEKFNTVVGERGARLSGGQRQRIGIARALYRLPNVLILDEATSALDTQTENNVLEEIMHWRSEITIIMVTHRISSLKHCTKIHKIDKGCIVPVDIDLLKNQLKTMSLD
jgi:ATP-binding cassette subfamily B protein